MLPAAAAATPAQELMPGVTLQYITRADVDATTACPEYQQSVVCSFIGRVAASGSEFMRREKRSVRLGSYGHHISLTVTLIP